MEPIYISITFLLMLCAGWIGVQVGRANKSAGEKLAEAMVATRSRLTNAEKKALEQAAAAAARAINLGAAQVFVDGFSHAADDSSMEEIVSYLIGLGMDISKADAGAELRSLYTQAYALGRKDAANGLSIETTLLEPKQEVAVGKMVDSEFAVMKIFVGGKGYKKPVATGNLRPGRRSRGQQAAPQQPANTNTQGDDNYSPPPLDDDYYQ